MILLKLRCRNCGWRKDILSTEGMPRCLVCSDRMRPAGPVREVTKAELEEMQNDQQETMNSDTSGWEM